MQFAGYSGQAFSPAGDKGRFVLPPLFRKAVRDSSDSKILCLAKHDRWDCLTGFGLSRKLELDAQLDREEEMSIRLNREFDRDMRAFQLFSFTEVPFDDSGRFVLPQYYADMAGISDEIYFQGAGAYFTLFAPEQLFEMGPAFDVAKATCRQFQADARKGRKA